MKKITFLLVMAVMVSAVLFAGGQQSGGSPAAGGLTTLKVFGIDYTTTWDSRIVRASEWWRPDFPSKLKDRFVEDLAKIGIKLDLELVPVDQYNVAITTLAASGQLNNYDFVFAGDSNLDERKGQAMADQGRLYAVNKLVAQYSTGAAKDYFNSVPGQTVTKLTTLADGNFYWLSSYMGYYYGDPSNRAGSIRASQIRKDWLDKLGLPMPATTEQFYNAVTAFRERDVNGNGVKDEVIKAPIDSFDSGIAQWFGLGTNDQKMLVSNVNGKASAPWYQSRVKDYITFMQRLYNAGVIRIDIAGSDAGVDMRANKIGFINDWGLDYWDEEGVAVPAGAAKAYFMPFVMQAAADTPPVAYREPGDTYDAKRLFYIPSGTKNAAALGKLLDYLFSKEYYTLRLYGIEGYTFNYDSSGTPAKITSNPAAVGADLFWQSLPFVSGFLLTPRIGEDKKMESARVLNMGKERGYPDSYQGKVDFMETVQSGRYTRTTDLTPTMAFPTARELDRIAAIQPDIDTYSRELLTGLITGQKSMNNWDSYMADLKRLGLDELVSIYQARLDRTK